MKFNRSLKYTSHLVSIGFLAIGISAHAASLPSPAAMQRLDQYRLEQYLKEQELKKKPQASPEIVVPEQASSEGEASNIKNINVSDFDVDHSDILSLDEISAVLNQYKGRIISLKELFAAVDQLNQLYDLKKMKTARALLPPQDVNDGVVKIRLVEAKLGEVKLSQITQTRSDFIEDRIHIKPGELMSVAQLEEDLIRFNRLYEPKLRANVTSGAEVGTTDINIEVLEPKKFSLSTFSDNAGRDTTGQTRLGAIFRAVDLLGMSDILQLVTTGSSGTNSYAVSYSIPVATSDTRLDLSYNYGNIKIVGGPFVPLDITGNSRDITVGLTQPFAVGLERQWAAYTRLSSKRSISQFSGFTQQDITLSVLALGLSGEAHYSDSAWYFDNSLNLGLSSFGGQNQFSYYRANFTRIDRIFDQVQLLLRGGLQYAPEKVLPSGEQFQVGGLYTVRGFSEGLLSGRNGYFGSAELRVPLNSPPPVSITGFPPLLQGLVFLDHGAALPYRPGRGINSDDYLTSVGAGLTMDFGSKISVKMTAAHPFGHNPAELNHQSTVLHAAVNVTWF